MEELADAVLSNRQELLYVPYKIREDKREVRDVGYLGQHPLLQEKMAEIYTGSLETADEAQGLSAEVLIGAAQMKDTQQPTHPPSKYRTGQSPGGEQVRYYSGLVNPPSELTVLGWQKIGWDATKEWLESVISKGAEKLVIIHSKGDVLYGGCSESEIKTKYDQIIAASGGTQKIVAAAEVSPYPDYLGHWYDQYSFTHDKMGQVLENFSLSADWVSAHANCSGSKNSKCSSPPAYKYLNSGFLMGPAVDLWIMLGDLYKFAGSMNSFASKYFLDHPAEIALDYSGALALSLHNLVGTNGTIPVIVSGSGDSKKLMFKPTLTASPRKVCFVHGNGNSFDALKSLAESIKTL
jgi:hypothetical protein